ncbi:MAG: hypothetical protein ACRBC3_14385 [Burkholderiaceae bacterium]
MVSYLAIQDVPGGDYGSANPVPADPAPASYVPSLIQSPVRPSQETVGAPGGDLIQPELDLSRPGLKTYLWQVCGTQILIEVSEAGQIRVNGEPVALAAKRA